MATVVGTFSRMVHASRKEMLDASHNAAAEAFYEHFELRDGDMIRYQQWSRNRHGSDKIWAFARIVSIASCYYNSAGGWTAHITVLPQRQDGNTGVTRYLMVMKDKKGHVDCCSNRGFEKVG
jgi:hypothetical protein